MPLGPELISPTGWTVTDSSTGVSGGVITLTSSGNNAAAAQSVSVASGTSVRISFTLSLSGTEDTHGYVQFGAAFASGTNLAPSGTWGVGPQTYSYDINAPTANPILTFATWGTNGAVSVIENVSVREIVPAGVTQEGYRFYNDDGDEAAATAKAAQDTSATLPLATNVQLRVLLDAEGAPGSQQYRLEYKKSTDADYVPVLTTATPPAPNFQAAGAEQGGTANITVPWPTHQAGDIGLLLIESTGGQAAALGTAAGFVEVPGSPVAALTGTSGTRLTAYWCRATSSSMASPVVTDPGDHAYGVILTFRGCIAAGNPWDDTATNTKETASTSASASGLTTVGPDRYIVNIIARDNDSASAAFSAWANATLVSVTELWDSGTAQGNGGGIGVAGGVKSAAGGVDQTTAAVTSSVNASLTLALKPPTTPIIMSASPHISASGVNTTARLTPPAGKTTSNFTAGRLADDENPLDAVSIASDGYTEVAWVIKAQAPAAVADQYQFRVSNNGTVLTAYAVTPSLTVGTAGATASVEAAAALQVTALEPSAFPSFQFQLGVSSEGAGPTVDVPTGALSMTANPGAPMVIVSDHRWVQVPLEAVEAAPQAPTVSATAHVWIAVPAASLGVASADPALALSDHKRVAVPAAGIEAEAASPALVATANVSAQPGAGQAQIQAYEPGIQVTNAMAVQVPAKALQASPMAPAVSTTANVLIAVPSASVAASAGIPAVLATADQVAAVPTAALQVDPADPVVAVTADTFVGVPLGAMDLAAQEPGIRLDKRVAVPAVSIGLQPLAPVVRAPVTIEVLNTGDLQIDAIDVPTVAVIGQPGVVKGHCVTARVLKRTVRADVSVRDVVINVSKRTVGVSLDKCD